MYNQGRYAAISHWEFIEVLEKIPRNVLDRIYISWWGNRVNEFHGKDAIIHPKDCDNCRSRLMSFYNSFVNTENLEEKQKLVEKISKVSCQCRDKYEKEKENQKIDKNIYQRLAEEEKKLINEFNL